MSNRTCTKTLQIKWCCINAIFNIITVILRWPVHLFILSWRSFDQYSAQYSFQDIVAFPHNDVKTTDSGERRMDPVAMTIINPRKEY